MTLLDYLRTKRESISAHAAWGFGIYAIVQVRLGNPVWAAILAVILAGVLWEIGGEIVSSILAHKQDREWGGCSIGRTQLARAQTYFSRVVSDLREPTIWRASLPDALTFWIGWVAGLITWGINAHL